MARLQLKRRASSLPRGGCQLPSLDRPGDTVLVWDQVTGLNQEQNHIRALSIRSCVHRARPAFHSLLTWVTGAWGGGGEKSRIAGTVVFLPSRNTVPSGTGAGTGGSAGLTRW